MYNFNFVFLDEGQVHNAEGVKGAKWEVVIPTCQRWSSEEALS